MSKPSVFEIFFGKDEQGSEDKERAFFSREITGSVSQRSKKILSGSFFKFTKTASHLIAHISSKIYGIALLSFGILGAMLYFLGISADGSVANPIVGIVCALLAVPLLLADKPLPILLQDFKPTDYIFFEFFCMKRHSVSEGQSHFPVSAAIAIGCLPAMLSSVLPFWQIAIIIGLIICVYIGMESPEFIFLISLFLLPYLRYIPYGEAALNIAMALAMISFARKVMYGRRVMYVEQYDIFIGAMLMFVLISGIFVKGVESFSGSVRMIVLAMGYFLAGNLITNRRLAELSANAIITSGAFASAISIAQFASTAISLGGSVTNDDLAYVLARQDGVAVFLMAALIFAGGIGSQRGRRERPLYILSAVICALGIIASGEMFIATSLIVGLAAYAVIRSNKLPGLLVPLLLGLSLLMLLLPAGILDFLFAYSPFIPSAEELFKLWQASMTAFADNLFVGIGIGRESFVAEMAALGIFGYSDSYNLFIELGLEAGMFALICFLMLLVTRVKHRSMQYLYVRSSQIGLMSNLSGMCLFCLLAFGMVNYVWSDSSAYYLFWCIFGIGSATLRVAKRDYNDRVSYYKETSAHDSSIIDIEIG